MIDKYTRFTNLELADFYYIIHVLNSKKVIQIIDENLLNQALLEILKDYKNEL